MRNLLKGILVLLFIVFAGCNLSENKPLIVSSIPVWKHVAEYIGGRDFRYYSVLKGGESPHGYEIKPSDVLKLKEAKLVIIHGLGLDDWILKGIEDKGKVFNIGELMARKYPEIKKPGYHIWTNPVMMEEVYFEVARKLSEFYPSKEKYYEKRADDYAAMIQQLLQRTDNCLKGVKIKKVIAYHPVWEPLFETIGVECIGYITDNPEKEPGPERIRKLIDRAKAEGIKLVITEKGEGEILAKKVASEIGANVLVLNPLPDDDYVVALSRWCNKICKALKEAYGK
ncbi:metal ABC transporter substrate-binding protein [Desulfurobacterium atlanticum]|uniref:Zinc transport system substrate-binding protein n=1 Tax=Desulfurobacterium atlanticum TaxID=240169 RepID=A0A238XSU2_9BACT|nr:metal ABC transporter substrate-binding protein [Desulfurobacterium atlanticum]SNR61404.1 zinc transport system substrate-binding protein [Desulfurobacterium atlanticum]